MSTFIAKALRESRFKLVTDAQNLINDPAAGDEAMATFDAMMVESDALAAKIERVEKAASEANKFNDIIGESAERSNVSVGQKVNELDLFKTAFKASLRQRAQIPLTQNEKVALDDYRNAASTLTGPAGGFTVPTTLAAQIYTALGASGGVREVANILNTATGNPIDFVMNDDTAQVATQVTEGQPLGTGVDLLYTKGTFRAWKFTSGIMIVSKELLVDSEYDIQGYVFDQLRLRFERGTNLAFTSGSGVNSCQGLVTAASVGKVAATGQTASIVLDDVIDMEFAVNSAYRRRSVWSVSDGFLKMARKLRDTTGHPLWQPSLIAGTPDTISGYKVFTNPDMGIPAAGVVTAVFGDIKSAFTIRQVLQLELNVLSELYAATGEIGLVALMRVDSRLTTSSTKALVKLTQAAT